MKQNWIHVTAGQGPDECSWVVYQALRSFGEACEAEGVKLELLEVVEGEYPKTMRSALLSVEGEELEDFLGGWHGTLQWIGRSPFREHHKRKNWFIGVEVMSPLGESDWDLEELRVERMRSSGPGGQHANKAESAVRITHLPTGLSAFAQEERSQYMNRKLAMVRLKQRLVEQSEVELGESERERWRQHNQLMRGNPTRIYEGEGFRLKSWKFVGRRV